MDPWYTDKSHRNNIYVYSANTTTGAVTGAPFHNRTSFDLYSIGSDGKTGHDALPANEFSDGNYCQNGLDDDGDSLVDELSTTEDNNGYLEDDINNW